MRCGAQEHFKLWSSQLFGFVLRGCQRHTLKVLTQLRTFAQLFRRVVLFAEHFPPWKMNENVFKAKQNTTDTSGKQRKRDEHHLNMASLNRKR